MGADMLRPNLKAICQYLVAFEKKPKEIEGRVITEWFTLGEKIFIELYTLGDTVKWNYSVVKKSDVSEVITKFTRNQDWLQTFINIYPTLRIDLDGVGSARNICIVRSGIEVLLQGFTNINSNFDKVLKDLEELGEVEELDRCLKIWSDSGHRPEFAVGDRSTSIPENHWWWH